MMMELATFVGNWVTLIFAAFVLLLLLGANFAPTWAKSRTFLVFMCALVIVGSNAVI